MTTEQIQQELEEVNGAFIGLLINDQTPLQIRAKLEQLSDKQGFLHKLMRKQAIQEAVDRFAAKQLKAEGCLVGGIILLTIAALLTVLNIWL